MDFDVIFLNTCMLAAKQSNKKQPTKFYFLIVDSQDCSDPGKGVVLF